MTVTFQKQRNLVTLLGKVGASTKKFIGEMRGFVPKKDRTCANECKSQLVVCARWRRWIFAFCAIGSKVISTTIIVCGGEWLWAHH